MTSQGRRTLGFTDGTWPQIFTNMKKQTETELDNSINIVPPYIFELSAVPASCCKN